MALGVGMVAFGWGILSAVSLPAGALAGLWLRPRRKMSSCLMAFGAGALLFALTIELFGHVPHHVDAHGMSALWAAVTGAILGGLLFDGLNRVLNNQGAYLRRLSNARKYVARLKMLRARKLVEELSGMNVLRGLVPEHMAELVHRVRPIHYSEGTVLFRQGDPSDAMYFVVSGEVEVVRREEDGEERFRVGQHDTIGELGLLRDAARSADAVAAADTRVYKILKSDVEHFLSVSPEMESAMRSLAESRIDALSKNGGAVEREQWKQATLARLRNWSFSVSVEDIRQEGAASAGNTAALAIWLGILIDGVPESLVIGMLATGESGMSIAFVAGVFLANFPESMSSAVSMRHNGMGLWAILGMWGSICLLTGMGAFAGAVFFPAAPADWVFLLVLGIEGLAAGAMLTMIAETMLPEAFEQGGSVVGLSTLAGFLTTLFLKVI